MTQFPQRPIHGEAQPLWAGDKTPLLRHGDIANIPTITPYFASDEHVTSAVVVLPGGGYGMRADHEGRPIAQWLNSIGISAFVVDYRVAPYQHPVPMLDASRGVRTVRYHAAEWGIEAEHIGILGFSAGGHLAATVATRFDDGLRDDMRAPHSDDMRATDSDNTQAHRHENQPHVANSRLSADSAYETDAIDTVSSRPDAAILCYPVISFEEFAHSGSRLNLLGDDAPQALVEALSAERQVTANTPPTFLWHTADDDGVPVQNSLLFAAALARYGVPFDLHVYEQGRHGLGLATEDAHVSKWTAECAEWLRVRGFR